MPRKTRRKIKKRRRNKYKLQKKGLIGRFLYFLLDGKVTDRYIKITTAFILLLEFVWVALEIVWFSIDMRYGGYWG